MKRKLVGIVIFPEVEILDFCGPYEVFAVTRLDEGRRREEPSPFQVLLVAEEAAAVEAAGGMRVLPNRLLIFWWCRAVGGRGGKLVIRP